MFFNVKIWGDAGRDLAASTSKGDVIQVEGRLDWYEWSPGDGPRREFVGIVANDTPGAVKCIATAPTPALVMGSENGMNMGMGVGFPQMPDPNNTQDLASTIAAQSATVDLGFPQQGVAPVPGVMPAPMQAFDQVATAGQIPPVAETLGPPAIGPQIPVQGNQPLPAATMEPAYQQPAPIQTPMQAPFAPSGPSGSFVAQEIAPVASAGAALEPLGDSSAESYGGGGAVALADPPVMTSPVAAIAAPEMPASLAGTEVPPGLAAYQNVPTQSAPVTHEDFHVPEIAHDEHDPNAALAADPEHEVIEEDSRFL
jgi:single-stranded DNA-binding protein